MFAAAGRGGAHRVRALAPVHARSMSGTSSFPAILVRQFGGPEELKLESKELPGPGAGQLLLQVKAAGVNPSCTYRRLGPHGPYAKMPHAIPSLPYTPGGDGAGVVLSVGDGVQGFAVGDRVYTSGSVSGSYAAQALADAAQTSLLPENVSFEQGACLGVPAVTAYHALKNRGRLEKGEQVFIHGASGAVGLAAVQLAKDMGSPLVVGTAGSPDGEEAVRSAGADVVLNHRQEGYLAKAKEAAGAGFHVALEMAADRNLVSALGLLRKYGRLCVIGSKAEPIGVNPRLLMPLQLDIRGVFLDLSPEEKAAAFAGLNDAMARGALKPVVGMALPLAEAAKAHVEVMAPSAGGAVGKIVLLP